MFATSPPSFVGTDYFSDTAIEASAIQPIANNRGCAETEMLVWKILLLISKPCVSPKTTQN